MKTKTLLTVVAALVLSAASAEVKIVEPAAGAVVPLLTEPQKAYVKMPHDERIRKFAEDHFRHQVMGLPAETVEGVARQAYWPKTVKLAWTAKPGAVAKVSVRDVKKGVSVYEATASNGVAYVDNLEIATEYAWTVTADGETASSAFRTEDLAPRLIRFPGVPNVRDLGGRIGLGGRRVRQGMLIRSAGLNDNAYKVWFTKDELKASGKLAELEQKAAAAKPRLELLLAWQKDMASFDREDPEFKGWCKRHPHDPPAKFLKSRIDAAKKIVEQGEKPKVVKETRPGKSRVEGERGEYIRTRFGIKTDIDLRSKGECFGMTGSPLGPTVRWVHAPSCAYERMQSQGARDQFAKTFRVLLDKANYPVVFHCIAGQDRTGSVAFILNALLGVEQDELYKDWEFTAFHNWNPKFNHGDRFWKLVKVFDAYPGETINERVEGYVRSLGFTAAEIDGFREFMLEK